MTLKTWPRPLFGLTASLSFGCGVGADTASTAPAFTYKMERQATGQKHDALLVDFPDGTGYQLRLSGDDLTSDTPFGEFIPFRSRVDLAYDSLGDHSLDLEIVQKNLTPYLTDKITWTYSTEVPDPPIVSFSQMATSTANVTMMIAGNRKGITNEIWVEGDLAGSHANGGFWDPLPDSNLYLLQVTPADGLKSMTVKLRNIYGNESATVKTSILKKSIGPINCRADMNAAGSASSTIGMQLSATNIGPLFYAVFGDVDKTTDFIQFTSGSMEQVSLSAGVGTKNLTIKIRDAASNYCDDIKKTITVTTGYVAQTIAVKGDLLWTESPSVDFLLRYDHFPSDEPIQMKITGDVTGTGVNQWVPYQQDVLVTLMPGSGEKKVFAQFMDKTLVPTFLVEQTIFFDPSIDIENAGGALRNVIVSNVIGLSNVSITGCQEPYNKVAYAASYSCTPTAATIAVTYTFADGTNLTKTGTP